VVALRHKYRFFFNENTKMKVLGARAYFIVRFSTHSILFKRAL